jgi:hypothetical protein
LTECRGQEIKIKNSKKEIIGDSNNLVIGIESDKED